MFLGYPFAKFYFITGVVSEHDLRLALTVIGTLWYTGNNTFEPEIQPNLPNFGTFSDSKIWLKLRNFCM